ncbi:MAG TPA: prepilin-type N-terminal cleavage/methylation domain-containing protein, partial [Crenalkalicoccus sp.]|nr:prepilin-type N-terminal cleavage/methylation domain-containing protein [Crenalkalicoccus sp.]
MTPLCEVRAAGGFTLIEMMVVLAVIALLMGLAAPWFASAAAAVRFRSAVSGVVGALREARGTALRTGRTVVLGFDPAGRSFGLTGSPA